MPVETPGYRFFSSYGVEEYDENTGGAKYTGDNLVLTVWRGESKLSPAPTLPVIGPILVPYTNSDEISDEERSLWQQEMHGRAGARFLLSITDEQLFGDWDLIFSVLNPPVELKQQLANSVVFNGGNPFDLSNFEFKKGQTGQFSFDAQVFEGFTGSPNFQASELNFVFIGQYINFSWAASPDLTYIPLLKTSGVDGVTPEFFEMNTEEGVQECIAAVNKGDFFIPMLTPRFNFPSVSGYKLAWSYSASRG